jgi:hypothetical protein
LLNIFTSFSNLILSLNACTKQTEKKAETMTPSTALSSDVQHIKVQHILVGFKGSLPGKPIQRSKEDTAKLAKDILAKAKDPKNDFGALVKEYTDDQAPGIYGMSNLGVAPQGEEFPRDQMVPAFGDVGFKLQVGEVGLAEYDQRTSPYGFHIIKRIN